VHPPKETEHVAVPFFRAALIVINIVISCGLKCGMKALFICLAARGEDLPENQWVRLFGLYADSMDQVQHGLP
jgi:hypothetical protein